MADLAVSAALALVEEFRSFFSHELRLKQHVVEEVESIKSWLMGTQAFLKDMEDKDGSAVLKDRVKQIRDVSYDIEDVLDEFVLCIPYDYFRGHKLLKKVHKHTNTLWHWRISSKIQDVRKKMNYIRALGSIIPCTNTTLMDEGSTSNSRTRHQVMRVLDDDQIVGFEKPREQLINQLTDREKKCMTIFLVGSGGSGKTVLVKNVYDSNRVRRWFDCHAWVHVSRSFNVQELLHNMLEQFCASRPIPSEGVGTEAKLRYLLLQKGYIVVFDEIWRREDWENIKNALPCGLSGSRIVITTQTSDVVSSCLEFSHVVHKLTGLSQPEAWDLFCRNAFRASNGNCPPELMECSQKIVNRCEGLPLALVEIGALLSDKPPVRSEWEKLHDSLGYEIIRPGGRLSTISRTFLDSYRELPTHLKTCILYFSIFPEDYCLQRGRLIRLWVAERFVVLEARGKTLEEVAEDYLNELIGRHLIHGSRWNIDGRVKSCRVRRLMLEFVFQKSKGGNFVLVLPEPSTNSTRGKVRRLSIHGSSVNLSHCESISSVRSAFLSRLGNISLQEFKLLRVLNLQDAPLDEFPEYISRLTLLRYLSLRNTNIKDVPKSIKRLIYLETLDLKRTSVTELPKQIVRLHNLRHLLAYRCNRANAIKFDSVQGVGVFSGIGALTNLQNLTLIKADEHCRVISELGTLTQLKKLGVVKLKKEDAIHLWTSIQKMQNLMTLDVCSRSMEEYLDLADMPHPPPRLQRLYLKGNLRRFPGWLSSLDHLFRISLKWSGLHISPLEALQDLASLMELEMVNVSSVRVLEFRAHSFKKLKSLHIEEFDQLHTVVIQVSAMPELEKLTLCKCLHLKMLPWGINNLAHVRELNLYNMHMEFIDRLQKSHEDSELVGHIPNISYTLNDNQGWSF